VEMAERNGSLSELFEKMEAKGISWDLLE